jgi:uncharacterized membrane protein YheB (UPF0754 family)
VKTLLLFTIPPLVGAVIGFVTNVVAIRMLFRPLKEIRFLGLKLPFTPGILPKHRHRLSQSIGAMVERELLTPEILRLRLACEDIRAQIKNAVSSFTEKILEKTPNLLLEGREDILTRKIKNTLETLYPSVTRNFIDFLNSDEIRRELSARSQGFLTQIFLQLNALQRIVLSAGKYDLTLQKKMPEIIDKFIESVENLLKESKIKDLLVNTAASSFDGKIGGQKNIAEIFYISEDDKKELDNILFEKIMSAADARIENLLSAINIKALVAERIDSLDMIRVERIILDVMADQFKWINIFGGILGFLIGAFQAIFSWIINN